MSVRRTGGTWAAQLPFYYGWVVVAGMALVGMAITLMLGANVGVFIRPMGDDLGIGSTPFGLAQTARLLAFAASGLVVGRLLDRFGARVPMAAAGAALGAAVAALGAVREGWQVVALFAAVRVIGFQSGQALYTTVPIASWFALRRGKAMAFAFSGVPVGIGVSGPLTQALIEWVGWRSAWVILGAGGGAVIVLAALLLVRRRPEDMGLEIDGGALGDASAAAAGRTSAAGEYSWTRQEAMRTRAFWTLAVAFGLFMFGTTSLSVFRVDFFVERGLSPTVAAWSLMADAAASTAVAVTAGLFLDRFSLRGIAACGFGVLAASYVVTMTTANAAQMTAAMLLFGLGIATGMVVQNAIWPAYFGRAHLGAIRGSAMPVTLAFSALGAPIAGLTRDYAGGYYAAWWTAIALFIAAAVLILATPPPRRPAPSGESR